METSPILYNNSEIAIEMILERRYMMHIRRLTPRVFFVSPIDGATVRNPVKLTMGTDNFIVEPAGKVRAGAGHLHILVDTDCIPAGQVIPKDNHHLHYGRGQLEADLDLTPGSHILWLQASDGAHVALPGEGMAQKITITVE